MATVAEIAKASYNWILERDAVAPLTANEIEDFIFALNTYMLALDAENVTLGYTKVAFPNDEVTVPTGALRGIIANMAVEMAPSYDMVVGPILNQVARDGLKQMRLIGQAMGDSFYPYTLPIGSGNEYDTGAWLWRHFYPDQEAEILAESTGAIGLEALTNKVIDHG